MRLTRIFLLVFLPLQLLRIASTNVIDLTHDIRPQDVRHASYFLATTIEYFPPWTIHVCVVDPGVGSDRAAIYADTGEQRLIGPDNGVFTGVFRELDHVG